MSPGEQMVLGSSSAIVDLLRAAKVYADTGSKASQDALLAAAEAYAEASREMWTILNQHKDQA